MSNQNNETIDKLLSGYVEQVKLGSRTWITLAVISIYSISISTSTISDDPKLPIIDISFSMEWFSLIVTGLMVALISRWLEAQSRASHTRRDLAEPLLIMTEEESDAGVSPKELWDARVIPSTLTVWSAPAHFARSSNGFIRWLSIPYLFFLKLCSISIHFGLPGFAIILVLKHTGDVPQTALKHVAVIILSIMALLQLLVGLLVELNYTKKSIEHMITLYKAVKSKD